MGKQPVSDNDITSDHLKTWILKVYIHCEGCKKKVYKILQSIEGVYKTVIDSKEHKVTVTGSADGDTIVQKLLKSGKQAEILPESFEATQPKKKKQSKKQKDDVPSGDETEHVDDKKEKSEDAKTDGGNDQEVEVVEASVEANDDNNNNGGKKKKKKKNKGQKDDNNTPSKEVDTPIESAIAIEKAGPEELNLGPPVNHMVYPTLYDNIPPYTNNYYPIPAYGVSYSTSYPSAESSYYTPPVYGYAQSHPHPSVYYPPPPPLSYYHRRSVFDDHDDESEGRLCTIM